jgi:hypothetical protein
MEAMGVGNWLPNAKAHRWVQPGAEIVRRPRPILALSMAPNKIELALLWLISKQNLNVMLSLSKHLYRNTKLK